MVNNTVSVGISLPKHILEKIDKDRSMFPEVEFY